jgi:hypothetical protein
MKLRPLWLAVPVIALVSGSCEKKPPVEAPAQKSAEVVPPVVPEVPKVPAAPVIPVLGPDERAAKFGIVKHLPKDTESFITIYNGSNITKHSKATKLWNVLREANGLPATAAAADTPSGETADPSDAGTGSGAGVLLGQEVFFATGKGSGTQAGNLLTGYSRLSHFQIKLLTKTFLAAAKKGEMKDYAELSSEVQKQSMLEVLKDPQSGVGLIDQMQMPPIYVGFKTLPTDREKVAQEVGSAVDYLSNFGEMVEPVEFECAGAKFSGYRLLGEKIAETSKVEHDESANQADIEVFDQVNASIKKKNLIVASGTLGDYVVVFLGSKPEDCQLVAEAKDSLASTDALAFADGYATKELTALVYGAKGMMDSIHSALGGFSEMASGLSDGIAGEDGLGDTRDIESLLQLVAEREKALTKFYTADTYGMVSFFEQGLKIETFGGGDAGALDWKTPSTLASLGKSDDVVLFANFTSDANYDTKAKAYAESLVETAYAVTKKVSELKIETDEFEKFQEDVKLFDEKFRTDTLTLLNSLSGDFSNGIGHESALVVDLKGSVPTIPGIPQVLVDKGRFLRASWIVPVTDRSKLASAWEKINEASTQLLKPISELAGKDIPMQKPISSEKNGFTTWFFSFPFINDDFVPSVTVGDKWFIASTSKTHALELASAAGKEPSDRTGFYLNVKLDPIRSFGTDWLNLIDENASKFSPEKIEALERFKTEKKKIEEVLVALSDFDSITAHVRREGGNLRGSIYFKTH